MRPILQPRFVNGPFSDPAPYVDVLFGPAGFIDRVEHRLASYTWNLVENYSVDLAIDACDGALVNEVQSAFRGVAA